MIAQIMKIFNRILTFFKKLSNKTIKQCETPTEETLNSNLESEVFITRDILEANNFKLLLQGNGAYIYSGINRRLVINDSRYFDGWDWTLDYNPQIGTATAFGRVRYVHELQQVLENNHVDIRIKV
jgi:hypothetical protein